MASTAMLEDWLELMGIDRDVRDLLAGRASPFDVEVAVANARAIYPGVSQDYVAVLGIVQKVVEDVRAMIARQNAAARAFNRAIDGHGPSAPVVDRLLTAAEVAEMQETMEHLAEEQADRADEIEELMTEIENLESELESMGSSIESEVEDAAAELEDAEAALEDAAAELAEFSEGDD